MVHQAQYMKINGLVFSENLPDLAINHHHSLLNRTCCQENIARIADAVQVTV